MATSVAREVAALLGCSDERDRWLAWVLAADRAGYERGYRHGGRAGYVRAVTDWKIAAGLLPGGPDHAELERRRYGPGGRAHFADPRPGDYQGGPAVWDGAPS